MRNSGIEAEVLKVFVADGAVKALAARFLCGPLIAPSIRREVDDNLGRFNKLALLLSNGSEEHAGFNPFRCGVV